MTEPGKSKPDMVGGVPVQQAYDWMDQTLSEKPEMDCDQLIEGLAAAMGCEGMVAMTLFLMWAASGGLVSHPSVMGGQDEGED